MYLESSLIPSKFLADYEVHIYWVLYKLHANTFFTKQSKYTVGLDAIVYLDHIVSSKVVLSEPVKVSTIVEWL